MSEKRPERFLWISACIALVVGLAVAATAAARLSEQARQLQTYASNTDKLMTLQELSAREQTAVQMYERLPNPHPVQVSQLLEEAFPGRTFEMREPPARNTIQGWTARRTEIMFGEIELAKLAEFIVRAERQRPPWRLDSCTIHASGETSGVARVRLVVEALDKTP